MTMSAKLKSKVGAGIAGAGFLVLALAGCSTAAPTAPTASGAPEASAAQFVACLKAEAVDAKISDEGYVLVKIASDTGGSISVEENDDSEAPLLISADSDGSAWAAPASSAYFASDPETQDAYATCEEKYPDFVQPEFNPESDPQVKEQQQQQAAAALEFARCARDEGFAWVADPDPETGSIELPADLTETEFRALLTACWDEDNPGLGWSLPDGDPDFDWQAVLGEVVGATSGSSSTTVEGDE